MQESSQILMQQLKQQIVKYDDDNPLKQLIMFIIQKSINGKLFENLNLDQFSINFDNPNNNILILRYHFQNLNDQQIIVSFAFDDDNNLIGKATFINAKEHVQKKSIYHLKYDAQLFAIIDGFYKVINKLDLT